ncbi:MULTISPECIES: TSUP family transporter [unclassified Aeromicrobium]|uniref:TSUP family transporter n=1 Tax=unclassified Aeromicrobium TaxID=2633570 RepID=UPI0020982519|nr:MULTISPECIES: TSUP family transporter [unclassified Aeromicrobium]MCO7239641.1 TSUP family transporter [Aeromicrobium sp. CnD17-E]MDR6118311.1 putative membrane protein YfcA [Aeromicrobium sp. SORGH_AS_0981]
MDDVTAGVLLFLGAAAFVAGWVDAVVGGGGLVQLPALLVAFPQAAPVQLLATNKVGSIAGTTTSSLTYLRRVRLDLRTAAPLAVAAFVGSLLGAVVASWIPRAAFNPVILVVLVAVGLFTVLRPELGQVAALRFEGRRHYAAALCIGAAVGFYDGALGPGTGSFFVFALVGVLGYGFLEASGKAKLANFATNLAALVVFVPQGVVMWQVAAVLAVCNVAGGYLGARLAVARGSSFVRAVFVVVVCAFTLRIGWDTWHQLVG